MTAKGQLKEHASAAMGLIGGINTMVAALNASVKMQAAAVDDIAAAVKVIGSASSNAGRLAIDAAFEAASAGGMEQSLAILESQVLRFSEAASAAPPKPREALPSVSGTIDGISVAPGRRADAPKAVGKFAGFAAAMPELDNTFGKLSASYASLAADLASLRELNSVLESSYAEMLSILGEG